MENVKEKKNIRNYHEMTMSAMHGIPNKQTNKIQNTFFPPHNQNFVNILSPITYHWTHNFFYVEIFDRFENGKINSSIPRLN